MVDRPRGRVLTGPLEKMRKRQLAIEAESRRVEAAKIAAQQAEAQRKRAEEEARKKAEAAYAAEKIRIGKKEFSRRDIELAQMALQRDIAGERHLMLYGERGARAAYEAMREYGWAGMGKHEIRRAISKGVEAKLLAKKLGVPIEEAIGRRKQLFAGMPELQPITAAPEFVKLKEAALGEAIEQAAAGKISTVALAEGRTTKEYQDIAKQVEGYKAAGIIPVYERGELKGFSDPVKKMSYRVQDVPVEKVPILQEAGVIQVTTPTEIPGIVTPGIVIPTPEVEGNINKLNRYIEQQRGKVETAIDRGELTGLKASSALAALGFASNVAGDLQFVQTFISDPKGESSRIIRGLGIILRDAATGRLSENQAIQQMSRTMITTPEYSLGWMGAEVVTGFGLGEVVKRLRTVGDIASVKLSSVGKKAENLGNIRVIKNVNLGDDVTDVKLVGRLGSKDLPLEDVAKQLKLAGQDLNIVSVQRALGKVEDVVTIKKPIPKEDLLSTTTQKLLKQFDEGTLSTSEIAKLDKAIRTEIPRSKGLIERFTFFDPATRARLLTRGGITQPSASLIDVFSGDFTFRRAKAPQILIQKAKIAEFPKEIGDIIRKLEKGESLTELEKARLLKWQATPTGQVKPLGAVTKEPEVILAPGESLAFDELVGTFMFKGRKVDVVKTRIIKLSDEASALQTKALTKTLTKGEARKLAHRLSKETGLSYSPVSVTSPKLSAAMPLSFGISLSGALSSVGTSLIARRGLSLLAPSSQALDVSRPLKVSPSISGVPSPRPSLAPMISPAISPIIPSKPYVPSPLVRPSPPISPFAPSLRPASTPISRPFVPGPPPPFIPSPFALLRREVIRRRRRPRRVKPAFDVYMRKRKKFVKIADDLPFRKSLKLGADVVGKNIRATFQLRRDRTTRMPDIDYTLNPKIWRRPRPTSKMKRPLTFIERRNKRLDFPKEVRQLHERRRAVGKTGGRRIKKSSKRKNNPSRTNNRLKIRASSNPFMLKTTPKRKSKRKR